MYNVLVDWLDDDKARARFALPGRVEWTAQHVDDLIRVLGQIRAEMSPQVAEEPPAPHEIQPLHDPRYATQLHAFSGGTVLEFRHPSLGWMEFVLPSLERRRMSGFLEEQEVTWRKMGSDRI